MALCISRPNSCVVLLFSFALLHLVQGNGNNSLTVTGNLINATSIFLPLIVNASTHITQPSSSAPIISSNVSLTSTIVPQNPNNTQTVHPIPTATANQNTTASSTNGTGSSARPTNRTNSVHIVTTTPTHASPTHASPTQPMTTKEPAKDKNDDSMKKRMWVAACFAILFAITTVILAYLVYRQRKINRELEGDPQAARLL